MYQPHTPYAHVQWMQPRTKPNCRFAARVVYFNTENKELHKWSDTRDSLAVHASGVGVQAPQTVCDHSKKKIDGTKR